MAEYDKFIELAKTLLTKKGRKITLQQLGTIGNDPAKPWNGCAVLALADGKTPVIRRFAEGNDMIVLSSHSYATASPDLMFNKRRIRIIGVVVWYQASHDHTLN